MRGSPGRTGLGGRGDNSASQGGALALGTRKVQRAHVPLGSEWRHKAVPTGGYRSAVQRREDLIPLQRGRDDLRNGAEEAPSVPSV